MRIKLAAVSCGERQVGESAKAYSAFSKYRDLSEKRTLAKVASMSGLLKPEYRFRIPSAIAAPVPTRSAAPPPAPTRCPGCRRKSTD